MYELKCEVLKPLGNKKGTKCNNLFLSYFNEEEYKDRWVILQCPECEDNKDLKEIILKCTRCDKDFISNKSKEDMILCYCTECRYELDNHSVRRRLNEFDNRWEDNKKRDPKKSYDEKGNEMGKESLIGTILFIVFFLGLIGIMISLSQESNDYRNESLPGRYGYSISKVSSHI